MSAIITRKTTELICKRLSTDILEANHNGLETVVQDLCDGEEELHSAMIAMTEEYLKTLHATGIQDQGLINLLKKMFIVSVLTGFLCERYSRDVFKDLDAINSNSDVARSYESVTDFLERVSKSSKKGKPSLKTVAARESDSAST